VPLPSSPGRLLGVDVARALALLGMVVAHTVDEGDPMAPGGVDPWFQLVSGRSAALFAVLAGVSIALMTRDAPQRRGRPLTAYRLQVATRALLVALVGLALGGPAGDVAVILTSYGLLFLLALPVLHWSPRGLALLAVGWGLLGPVLSLLLRRHLPDPSYAVPSLLSLIDPAGLALELLVTGYYPVATWGTYLVAGLAVGRLDLRSPRVGSALTVGGALLAAAALGLSAAVTRAPAVREDLLAESGASDWAALDTVLRMGMFGTHPTEPAWWLLVWSPHSGSIVSLAHTTGTALLVTGACLLAAGGLRGRARRAVAVAFGAGTMTLTLYVVHVAVLWTPESWGPAHSTTAHLLGVLGLGALFVAARSRGPLEVLVTEVSGSLARPPRTPLADP
jgi:uncharacterized membrane protein YeiB